MKTLLKKPIVSFLLIGLLFCSVVTFEVRASPEGGIDYLEEGEKYEFFYTASSKGKKRKFSEEPQEGRAWAYKNSSEGENTIKIERIEDNYIMVTRSTKEKSGREEYKEKDEYMNTFSVTVNDTAHWDIDNAWNRDDDKYMDYNSSSPWGLTPLNISLGAPHIIAGSWENFTDPLGNFSEGLENVSEICESFAYSFSMEAPKIELTADWKAEAYPSRKSSEEFNGTVTYDCHEQVTLEYEGFVIKKAKRNSTMEMLEVENQTFLEEHSAWIDEEESSSYLLERKGFFEKETRGLANWVWTAIGVGVVVVIVIGFVRWKK